MLFNLPKHHSHSGFCACSHCFETCCGVFDPKWDRHIGEQAQSLIQSCILDRHKQLSLVELPERMNSYERWRLIPFMSNEAIAKTIMEVYIPNSSLYGHKPSTYDESIISIWLPVILERLKDV